MSLSGIVAQTAPVIPDAPLWVYPLVIAFAAFWIWAKYSKSDTKK